MDIYYIGYITIKTISDCENIHRVNPLYLLVKHAVGYTEFSSVYPLACLTSKYGNKYLIFYDSVNENKGLLKKIRRCLGWN